MKSLSSKINSTQFKKIDSLYSKYKAKEIKNENLKALYKTKLLTISVFKNDTLLLQGDEKAIYAFNQQVMNGLLEDEKKSKTKSSSKKIFLDDLDGTIGMDEVGTGDYFGPVVTCACYLPNKNIDKVKALGVNDSKKIDDTKIIAMAKQLQKYTSVFACVCDNKSYNKLIDKYDNNNIVKTLYHNGTLAQLKSKLKSSITYKVILDQFVSRENYFKYLDKVGQKPENIDIIEVKAEGKYLAVACASVVARAVFLTQMASLEKKCGLVLPKGSTQIDKIVKVGKQLIKKHNLKDYAKLHFESITDKINN